VKNPVLRLAVSLPFTAALLLACSSDNPIQVGSPTPAPDTGFTPAAIPDAGVCHVDADCQDQFFCNGEERCMPGATGANANGCIRPNPVPCMASQHCNEAMARCETLCPHAPDADGDGHRSIDCGGDDCDDNDPNRFPGNAETCAGDPNHDEDCDPLTVGNTDADSDGYISSVCCNVGADGVRHCGLDCNDANPGVHPGLPEACNGIDDNCNGQIDEGAKVTLYVDADHDGFGAPGVGSMQCPGTAGYSAFSNDCDDTNAAIVPGSVKCDNPQFPDSVLLCSATTGAFTSAACAKNTVCVTQPNGTGICR